MMMQVTIGNEKVKLPLLTLMSPGSRPSQPRPTPDQSNRPPAAMSNPTKNSNLPRSFIYNCIGTLTSEAASSKGAGWGMDRKCRMQSTECGKSHFLQVSTIPWQSGHSSLESSLEPGFGVWNFLFISCGVIGRAPLRLCLSVFSCLIFYLCLSVSICG